MVLSKAKIPFERGTCYSVSSGLVPRVFGLEPQGETTGDMENSSSDDEADK